MIHSLDRTWCELSKNIKDHGPKNRVSVVRGLKLYKPGFPSCKKFANLQLQIVKIRENTESRTTTCVFDDFFFRWNYQFYTQTFWRIFPNYDRGVTNLGFQLAKNLQICSCKWWPVQMRACKQDSSNSASIFSWVIKAVKVVLCQINKFCKQLTQNTTTDFVRFTKICSGIQNTSFASF